MTSGRFARVAAIASALPERVVPNSYFESILDTSDAWIQERTGIKARRFAGPGQSTGTLAADAAREALRRAETDPGSVDLLIIATCTPDRFIPSTAAFVQARVGLSCPSFDINAACAGFTYGLSVADAQIRAGAADRVMLVGAEVLSRALDFTDRSTCVLFGDGAGAALLEPAEEPGVIDSVLALDGGQAGLLTVPAGGFEEPITPEGLAQRRNFLRMLDGQAVFKQAVTSMAAASQQALEKAGLAPEDVDLVVGHQANARILAAVGKRLGLDPRKVLIDIATVGNTSGASIPIALDRAWRRRMLAPGDVVLTTAFGAGMAWGANVMRWTLPKPDDSIPPPEDDVSFASADRASGA
jgi:3-oxoacyl-[acyl-carrier-protein] synthase III